MIQICPSILSLRPATTLNSEDTSSGKCPLKGTTLLLTPLSRNSGIREEATRRFPHKNKSFPTKHFLPSAWNMSPRKLNKNLHPPRISGRITRNLQAQGIGVRADWSLQDMTGRVWNRTSNLSLPRTSTTSDWSWIPTCHPQRCHPIMMTDVS